MEENELTKNSSSSLLCPLRQVFNNVELVTYIIDYLGILPQCKLISVSSIYFTAVLRSWSSQQSLNDSLFSFPSFFQLREVPSSFQHMLQLLVLDLSNCSVLQQNESRDDDPKVLKMGDRILQLLAGNCKQLSFLNVSKIATITDSGIEMISIGCQKLKEVDITFCSSTTFRSVLILRGIGTSQNSILIPSELRPILIRRLPIWLQGHFYCPWGEVHTYYPDGSFTFSRNGESKGWVSFLSDRGDHLADRLRYIDAQIPRWMSLDDFQPGVLLRKCGYVIIQSNLITYRSYSTVNLDFAMHLELCP